MMMPSDLLLDVVDCLWEHVKEGRSVPLDLAVALHDGIADLHEAMLAGEASTRALLVLQDHVASEYPMLTPIRERRRAAIERDGNVLRLPLPKPHQRPSRFFPRGGGDAA